MATRTTVPLSLARNVVVINSISLEKPKSLRALKSRLFSWSASVISSLGAVVNNCEKIAFVSFFSCNVFLLSVVLENLPVSRELSLPREGAWREVLGFLDEVLKVTGSRGFVSNMDFL